MTGIPPKLAVEGTYQPLNADQQSNPYNEVVILSGHISTVHQIERVDDERFISASNDGTAVIWDAKSGCKLHVLQHGYKDRVLVTCVLPLQPFSDSSELCLIMTADSEGVIRLWDVNVDDPFREEMCQKEITEHNGRVKCLVQFSHELICSGGEDLCLWDRNARLLSKFNRSQLEETSDIHSVLKLDSRHFGIVAASNYKSLAVYDINKSTMSEMDRYEIEFVRYIYSSHLDVICCLTSISANFFASGSRDGVIYLWSTNSLSPMKMFSCAELIPKEISSSASTEIRHILVIGERYLFAAVGCGFKVYDVLTYEDSQGHPKPLANYSSAHQQPITYMEFIEERAILATASEDSTVRLWGHPSKTKKETDNEHVNENQGSSVRMYMEEFLGIELNPQLRGRRRGLTIPVIPVLLGELLLHSSPIKMIKDLGEYGLVTCGADNLIVLWKDDEKERESKDIQIRSFLRDEQD